MSNYRNIIWLPVLVLLIFSCNRKVNDSAKLTERSSVLEARMVQSATKATHLGTCHIDEKADKKTLNIYQISEQLGVAALTRDSGLNKVPDVAVVRFPILKERRVVDLPEEFKIVDFGFEYLGSGLQFESESNKFNCLEK